MKPNTVDVASHRWMFYSSDQLAFCAMAHRTGKRTLAVHIVETTEHADSVPLPDRLRAEQAAKSVIQSELAGAVGSDWSVEVRFGLRPAPEKVVARIGLEPDLARRRTRSFR